MRPILFFAMTLISLRGMAQKSAGEIINSAYHTLISHKSVGYSGAFSFRGYERTDTLVYDADIALERVSGDPAFGGKVWVNTHANKYTFYDLKNVYNVDKYTMSVRITDQFEEREPNVDYSLNLGGFYNSCIWYEFLHPKEMKKLITKADTLKLLHDTVVNGKKCHEVYIRHIPKDNRDYPWTELIYITATGHIPIFTRHWSENGGEIEYTQLLLTAIIFDKVDDSKFSRKQIPSSYGIKEIHHQK